MRSLVRFVPACAVLAFATLSVAAQPAHAQSPGPAASPSPSLPAAPLAVGAANNPAGVTATVTARTGVDPLAATIAFSEQRAGKTLRAYDLDMTKYLHMIVISDDFTSFQHVHPALGNDGTFKIDLSVPKAATYHIYADAVPHGVGHTVFRVDWPFGNSSPEPPALTPTGQKASAGPYVVKLSTLVLNAGKNTVLTADVSKNGKPAKDLTPYLGGMAHAVFINAKTLEYVHVHPMSDAMKMMNCMGCDSSDMGGMNGMDMEQMTLPDGTYVNPHMILHVTPPRAGTYKLWLQFRGGGALHVAPFMLTAR